MTTEAITKGANLSRSINKYVYDNLQITESLDIDYSGLPFNDTKKAEWIQVRINDKERQFLRQGSRTQYANNVDIYLSFIIKVKKSSLTVVDRHYKIRDIIVNYFKIGQKIELRDYLDDDSLLCYLIVRSVEEDNSIQDSNELLEYLYQVKLNFTELLVFPT